MVAGTKLKQYRNARKVGQTELAVELKKANASYVCRMERRELTNLQFAEAVAAIERIFDRRMSAANPGAAVAS